MTNIFGTDGIRCQFGTNFLTNEKITMLGHALAKWATQKYGMTPHFLMLNDTRISCNEIAALLQSSLLNYPVHIIDVKIMSTPAALQLLELYNLDCAIIISASHNPYYDNGIKIIDRSIGKLHLHDEEKISTLVLQGSQIKPQHSIRGTLEIRDGKLDYCNSIIKKFTPHFLTNIKIVLDLAHGATYESAPYIFKMLGATVISMNNTPNGYNINENCGALATQALQERVLIERADFGFAFDGDGDRVMAVNRHGVLKNGDDILAILSQHPLYKTQTIIVSTVMANQGFEDWLNIQNKKLLRTCVGDKYVTEQLLLQKLLLGGEQSGHIIVHDLARSGDGVLAALRLLEAVLYTKNNDLVSFKHYPQVLMNVIIKAKRDLTCNPFALIITQAEKGLSLGRILVRYSGTENFLRIMVESENHKEAKLCAENLAKNLQKTLE